MYRNIITGCVCFILGFILFTPLTKANTEYDKAVFWPNQKLSTLDGQFQYFDAAWPKTTDATKKFPLVIWMHGSGWFAPVPKSSFSRPEMETLAKKGFVVVSMNYRISNLASTTKPNLFPAAIQDARCAVKRFRSDRYPELPIDKNNIFVAGSSAGGNTALMLAALGKKTEEDLALYPVTFDSPDCEYNEQSAEVQGAISLSGPIDLMSKNPIALKKPPVTYIRKLDVISRTAGSNKSVPLIDISHEVLDSAGTDLHIKWTTRYATKCTREGGDWTSTSTYKPNRLNTLASARTGSYRESIANVQGSKTFVVRCEGPGGVTSRSITAMAIHTSVNYLGVQPSENPDLARAASPYRYFQVQDDSEQPPLLFMHGSDDTTVPVRAVQDLVDQVLIPRQINHRYIEVSGGTHGLPIWSDEILLDKLVSFIEDTRASATSSPVVLGSSMPILTSGEIVIKPSQRLSANISLATHSSQKNNEVMLLESFLNTYEKENLVVDGVYTDSDVLAVKRFQTKYAPDILTAQGLQTATGYVGALTRQKINTILEAQ